MASKVRHSIAEVPVQEYPEWGKVYYVCSDWVFSSQLATAGVNHG